MNKPTIEIFLTNNTWHADMSHADDAEGIKKLFGTYVLPTPFTAKTEVANVAQELERKNPGHEILVPF